MVCIIIYLFIPHLMLLLLAVVEFYTTSQGWSKEEVEDQIIRIFNTSEISNFSEVDLTSIMMCVSQSCHTPVLFLT